MPVSDLIDLSIALEAPPLALAGFGVPLIAGDLDADVDTAFGSPLTIELTPTTWKTQLASVNIVSSDPIYTKVAAMFGQTRQPPLVLLARRATPVAQVTHVNVDGTDNGDYTVSIGGNDFTFAASGNTDEEIKDGLVALIPGASGLRVTAGTVDTNTLSVTADEAGEPFTLTVSNDDGNLSIVSSVANVGIGEDITAWKAERDDWYFLDLLERTSGTIATAAAAIESERKILIAQTDDANAQAAGSTDIGSELGALAYVRTALVWNDSDSEYVDSAWIGKMAPSDPGSETWHAQQLTGVTGFVPTSSTNLKNKKYNWLELFSAGNFSMMVHGWAIGGTYIDLVRGRDWLFNLIQTRVLQAMRDEPKIPYTTEGGELLGNVIGGCLHQAADVGLVARDTIVVTVPTPEDQTSANKGNRYLPNITFGATLVGAVHTLEIEGNLAF